jgi:hypothetical protein
MTRRDHHVQGHAVHHGSDFRRIRDVTCEAALRAARPGALPGYADAMTS